MRPDIVRATGVRIILEGRTRLQWSRVESARWRLDGVWPSAREHRGLRRSLARGQNVLVVQGDEEIWVDLLDEEIVHPHAIERYVARQDGGVATLRVRSLDWAPSVISREARALVREQRRVRETVAAGRAVLLTPALGRRHNLRLLHVDQLDADRLSHERLLQLIELAFPDDSPPRKKEQP